MQLWLGRRTTRLDKLVFLRMVKVVIRNFAILPQFYGLGPTLYNASDYRTKANSTILRFVADLLYNTLYSKSTTKRNNGLCT